MERNSKSGVIGVIITIIILVLLVLLFFHSGRFLLKKNAENAFTAG